MKKNNISIFFNKSLLRANLIAWLLGNLIFHFFSVKLILSEYLAAIAFTKDDVVGLVVGGAIFILFFPLLVFLYFIQSIGEDFFITNRDRQ